jgi:hypothetical protein
MQNSQLGNNNHEYGISSDPLPYFTVVLSVLLVHMLVIRVFRTNSLQKVRINRFVRGVSGFSLMRYFSQSFHCDCDGHLQHTNDSSLKGLASAPLLAPVVGGLGLAMVGAPWLVLHKPKEKSEAFTQQLTEAFWAQAEPEVFVACIEHWTHFLDDNTKPITTTLGECIISIRN